MNGKLISLIFAAGRFDEDGSFIGQYGTMERQKMQRQFQAAFQQQQQPTSPSPLQIYSKSAAGGTYV